MKILIVEGNQDKDFISQLFRRRKIDPKQNYDPDFEIVSYHGYAKLIKRFGVQLNENNQTVGIIVDADTELKAHWEDLKKEFVKRGYQNLPRDPDPKGTIIESDDPLLPKLGIWLMPDNQLDGTLETFIQFLIPDREQDKIFILAEKIVNDLIQQGENKFSKSDKTKATLHIWLALQEEPGLSLGQAINYRFLKKDYILDDKKATPFLQWLQKLFKD